MRRFKESSNGSFNDWADTFDESFVNIGLFSGRELVRMADTKLLAEVVHAIYNGIETTNKKKLDDLYQQHEAEFSERRRSRRG